MSKIFPRHESTQVRDLFNLFIYRFSTTICVNSSHCPLCKIKSPNHILRDRCLYYSIFKYFNKENNPLEPCLTCKLVLNFSPALSQALLLFGFKTWQVWSSCTGIESQWMEAEITEVIYSIPQLKVRSAVLFITDYWNLVLKNLLFNS